MEKTKINYEKRPVPTKPGAKQITIEGDKAMKGGADLKHPLPMKNMVKDGSKK